MAVSPGGNKSPLSLVPESDEEIRARDTEIIEDIFGLIEDKDTERHKLTLPRLDSRGNVRAQLVLNVRPMRSEEIEAAREMCRVPKYDQELKVTRRVLDEVEFECKCIYDATMPEDRARLWDKAASDARFGDPMRPHMIVDRVLKPGERAKLYNAIEGLSGWAFTGDLERLEAVGK